MSIYWLIYVVHVCMVQMCLGQEVHLKLPGNVVAPPVVSVIEGGNLSLSCYSDIANSSTIWSKPGNTDFYREGRDLKLDNVKQDHGGEYICKIFDQSGPVRNQTSVEVNVLYGVGLPVISGPNSALKEEIVNLTCSADSNPSPSYYWSHKPEGVPVAHRGPMFTETNFPENFKFYCFAETTMVPTQGESVTSSASTWKKVTEHVGAYIYDLPKTLYIQEGDTLDVDCTVYGRPTPDVYWTGPGQDGNTTVSTGSRWVVLNVRKSLEDTYVCRAENTISDVTGSSMWINDAEVMRIQVTPTGTLSSTTNGPCSLNCTNQQVATPEESCSNGIIAALVIGWIVALTLFLIGLFYYIRIRDKQKTPSWSKHHPPPELVTRDSVVMTRPSEGQGNSERPQLPKRPLEQTDSKHSYISLDAATRQQPKHIEGNSSFPVSNQDTPTDDYLTPQPDMGATRGSMVQPDSSARNTDTGAKPCNPDNGNNSQNSDTDYNYVSIS